MCEDTKADDVAKVLQGTHYICIIDIPGREYDLISNLLENKKPWEEAAPAAPLVRRRFNLFPGYFLELELYNPMDEDDEPVLMIDLMGFDPEGEGAEKEWLEEAHRAKDVIPDSVEFYSSYLANSPRCPSLKGKSLLIRLRRKD